MPKARIGWSPAVGSKRTELANLTKEDAGTMNHGMTLSISEDDENVVYWLIRRLRELIA
jgi:hypothetical protein